MIFDWSSHHFQDTRLSGTYLCRRKRFWWICRDIKLFQSSKVYFESVSFEQFAVLFPFSLRWPCTVDRMFKSKYWLFLFLEWNHSWSLLEMIDSYQVPLTLHEKKKSLLCSFFFFFNMCLLRRSSFDGPSHCVVKGFYSGVVGWFYCVVRGFQYGFVRGSTMLWEGSILVLSESSTVPWEGSSAVLG